jgi:hypothetical protein
LSLSSQKDIDLGPMHDLSTLFGGAKLIPAQAGAGSHTQKNQITLKVQAQGQKSAQLSAELDVSANGVHTRLQTLKPVPLQRGIKAEDAGNIRLTLTPTSHPESMKLSPVVDISAKMGFEAAHVWFEPKGDLFSTSMEGQLGFDPKDSVYWGEVKTAHLNVSALAVPLGWGRMEASSSVVSQNPVSFANAFATRFLEPLRLPMSGDIVVYSERTVFSPGLTGEKSRMTFALTPEQLVVKDISARIDQSELSGTLTLKHQNGRASVAGNLAVADAQTLSPALREIVGGRTQTSVTLGATGETLGAMLANLNGNGEVRWESPFISHLSAQMPFEAAKWALNSPISATKTQAEVSTYFLDLLNRHPFRALDPQPKTMALTLSGGLLKAGPVALESKDAQISGRLSYDLKQGQLAARADVQATSAPQGWRGSLPLASVIWKGTAQDIKREVDATSLNSGIIASRLNKNAGLPSSFIPSPPKRPLESPARPLNPSVPAPSIETGGIAEE